MRHAQAWVIPSTSEDGYCEVETIQVEIAPRPIVRKPSNADASPASFPNGLIVNAVANGFARPIPQRKRIIDKEYHPNPGLFGPKISNAPATIATMKPISVINLFP